MSTAEKIIRVGSLLTFLTVCPLASTWGATAASAASPRSADAFGVAINVEVRTPGVAGIHWLNAVEQLAPGDELVLHIDVRQSVYVYVTSQDEKGSSELLFPSPESGADFPAKPSKDVRIPDKQGVLKFDPSAKDALLRVVASRRPLVQKEAEQLGLRWPLWHGGVTADAKDPPPKAPQPAPTSSGGDPKKTPDPCKAGSKGQPPHCRGAGGTTRKPKGYIAKKQLNDQGVAILELPLRTWH